MTPKPPQFAGLPRTALTFAAVTLASLVGVPSPGLTDSTGQSSLIPPEAVTPQIVALRGCIEGVAHPSERTLTLDAQVAACDDHVDLSENRTEAVYFRALHLFERGTTAAHRAQAHRDFSEVIAAEGDAPPAAFANRALLNVKYEDAPGLALIDIDAAIAATSDQPRHTFFERRAYIHVALADRNGDADLIRAALGDLEQALAIRPDSAVALRMQDVLTEYLQRD